VTIFRPLMSLVEVDADRKLPFPKPLVNVELENEIDLYSKHVQQT